MVHNMMMMGKGPRAWIQLGFCLGLVLLLVGRGGECAGEASVESASGDSWWGSFWEDLIPEGWKGMFKRGSQKEGTQVLSEAEILKLEAPRTGFVAAGQGAVLKLKLPANDGVFPNVEINLLIGNPKGAADLYCVPPTLFSYVNVPPGPDLFIWKSDHSHGNDIIFISKDHKAYGSAKTGLMEDKTTPTAVEFICTVVGYAAEGTEYTVEVDVDYTDRMQIQEEKDAMQEIFDSCCAGKVESCNHWKATATESKDGVIKMDFCHLSGNVCNPDGRLIRLDMAGMGLTCNYPTGAFEKLKAVEKINLAQNNLTGSISDIIDTLAQRKNKLRLLDLSDNHLNESIADSAEALCQLTHGAMGLSLLNLARNELNGSIPECLLDDSSNLKEFVYDDNSIIGDLPVVGANSMIKVLSLSGVGLKGGVPSSLGQSHSLIDIDLSRNLLEGSIPEDLGSSKSLRVLKLQSNNLQGNVPNSLAKSSSLQIVNLGANELSGFSSRWYDLKAMDASSLMVLRVANNRLQGPFPSAIVGCRSLEVLDLRENNLSGMLPNSPGMLPRVTVFLAGGNDFEGEIPMYLSGMSFFSDKALAASHFEPRLDFSRNKLSGRIPDFLYVKDVPRQVWKQIMMGGNEFDLSCPLSHNLVHIMDLNCDNTVVGSYEGDPVTVKESLKKSLLRLGIAENPSSPIETDPENSGGDVQENELSGPVPVLSGDNRGESIPVDGANPAGALMKDDGLSGVMIAGIVLFAAIGVAIPMFFLYRRHKRVKWDKAVEAVLVRDLELGPKVSNEDDDSFYFQKAPHGSS